MSSHKPGVLPAEVRVLCIENSVFFHVEIWGNICSFSYNDIRTVAGSGHGCSVLPLFRS